MMIKPNMYDLIQTLPLEKVVGIETNKVYKDLPKGSNITLANVSAVTLFDRLTVDLSLPFNTSKCKECNELHYIDHNITYCVKCHYPYYFTDNVGKTTIMNESRYSGLGLFAAILGSALLWYLLFFSSPYIYGVLFQ